MNGFQAPGFWKLLVYLSGLLHLLLLYIILHIPLLYIYLYTLPSSGVLESPVIYSGSIRMVGGDILSFSLPNSIEFVSTSKYLVVFPFSRLTSSHFLNTLVIATTTTTSNTFVKIPKKLVQNWTGGTLRFRIVGGNIDGTSTLQPISTLPSETPKIRMWFFM